MKQKNTQKTAFDILKERGFLKSVSHEKELEEAFKKPVTFYLGIDPTADNLHIGHFFSFRVFKILQDLGHKGILLIGNATGMIGDPSFKNDMRKMQSTEETEHNTQSLKKALSKVVDVESKNAAQFVFNADWMNKKGYVDFMREVGTHFNVARMLAADCYKTRLEAGGLTFLEMGYMLMQAYDFCYLNETMGATLQIGGSDQWGNILAGVELSRKFSFKNKKERPLMMAFCTPLLIGANGKKMGKTEKGALWLNKEKTSVYDFYQYFLNVDDADVCQLLKFFTMIDVNEIEKMCKDNIIEAKKIMAFEVIKLVHGEDEAIKVVEVSKQLFSGNQTGENAPTKEIKKIEVQLITDILVESGLTKSKREAKELIEAGAISIDGEVVKSINEATTKNEFLIKKGKKTFLKVKLI